jgi:hypothetical protein
LLAGNSPGAKHRANEVVVSTHRTAARRKRSFPVHFMRAELAVPFHLGRLIGRTAR